MKLEVFRVDDFGPGPMGHGHPVPGGPWGIGRVQVEVPRPAGSKDGGLCEKWRDLACILVEYVGSKGAHPFIALLRVL